MDTVIGIGSLNPVKINAVKNIIASLSEMIGIEDSFSIRGYDVPSGVPEQPIGLDQIINGAINRAKEVAKKDSHLFSIGLEAGVYGICDTFLDVQFCAIIDKEDKITVGHSGGFAYPDFVIDKINEGMEVGDIFAELSGNDKIKHESGAIGMLSKGQIDRTAFSMQSVLMAMIPRLSIEYYDLKKIKKN